MREWVRSPAKINLFLRIIGKRSDGYHELTSLMCGISLFDTIEMDYQASSLTVACDHPDVPAGEENIVHRAAMVFFSKIGRLPKASIRIHKHIPIGGGLGGGSSNAAAVIDALNRRYRHPLPSKDLMSIATSLGADVPFFLSGGPAIASGIGERLTPCKTPLPFHVVLVWPGFSVSTAEIYKKLKIGLTKSKKKNRKFSFGDNGFNVAEHLYNELEPVTAALHPVIPDIKKELVRQGAVGALMTGSGSSVFGLFCDLQTACIALRTLSRNTGWRCFLAEPLTGCR